MCADCVFSSALQGTAEGGQGSSDWSVVGVHLPHRHHRRAAGHQDGTEELLQQVRYHGVLIRGGGGGLGLRKKREVSVLSD